MMLFATHPKIERATLSYECLPVRKHGWMKLTGRADLCI